jgi:hypothetical protein
MSQSTSLSIPESVQPAFIQLQDELTKVEEALLELQQKKYEVLQHQLSAGIYNLTALASNINSLANSLEFEILKFKQTALEVNHLYDSAQSSLRFKALTGDQSIFPCFSALSVCEIKSATVPVPIVIRQDSQFILTIKAINVE